MKWPWVSHKVLDTTVGYYVDLSARAWSENDRLTKLIIETKDLLAAKEAEIASMSLVLIEAESKKCNHYTKPDPDSSKIDKSGGGPVGSRSGWRGRALEASIKTLPKVNDSRDALIDKVKREGGTV